MNWVTKVLIWAGGYKPATLIGKSTEDIEPITIVGCGILFSTAFSIVNWGIAGFTFSNGNTWITAGTAAVGAIVVLLFDRAFVYLSDTTTPANRIKVVFFAMVRTAIVLAIGSITSQAVLPLILGNELKVHALHMEEESVRSRTANLRLQLNVPEIENLVKSMTDEVARLEGATETLPSSVQQRLAAAQTCWLSYGTQKSSLIASGATHDEARVQLAWKASNCSRDEKSAKSERDVYFLRMRDQLEKALSTRQESVEQLVAVKAITKAKLDHGHEVEAASYNEHSSTVLWSLINSDSGAMTKWLLCSFLNLVLELCPFILKLMRGRSVIGLSIADRHEAQIGKIADTHQQRKYDKEVAREVRTTSLGAAKQALRGAEVTGVFKQVFEANMAAYAPTEAVCTMLNEFESKNVDVGNFIRRYPQYAPAISQAWSQAIKDTSAILARGLRPSSAHG